MYQEARVKNWTNAKQKGSPYREGLQREKTHFLFETKYTKNIFY